jgi:hypothetical protein
MMGTSDTVGTYSMITCSKKNCADRPLYRAASGVYTLQSGAFGGNTLTPFSRQITFSSLDADSELVTSVVSWSTDGVPYTVTVYDALTPWQ